MANNDLKVGDIVTLIDSVHDDCLGQLVGFHAGPYHEIKFLRHVNCKYRSDKTWNTTSGHYKKLTSIPTDIALLVATYGI